MFTITKQFDQRNDDQCQLAQITKGQLELHKRHPSLRVGLRDIFIFKKCSLTRYTEVYLRAEPSTVMAAPEPHIAVRFYSTKFGIIWQDFYSTLTATSLQFSAAAIRSSARSCTMCFFCSMSATSAHETPAAEANSRCDILSACRCKIRLSISSI